MQLLAIIISCAFTVAIIMLFNKSTPYRTKRIIGIILLLSFVITIIAAMSSILNKSQIESNRRKATIAQITSQHASKIASRSSNPLVFYDHNGKQYTKSYKCPKCKTVNKNGNINCENCGYKLTDSMVYCKNCGASFLDTYTYCPHCKEKDLEHY